MSVFRTPIDLKNCVVDIVSGLSGTVSSSLSIHVGNGNLSWTEKRNVEYVRDRGLLDTVRRGDDDPMEVRFNATYVMLTQDVTNGATEPISIRDALTASGAASSWASSSLDPCEPYAVNLRLTYDPICPGIKNEVVLFPDFRYETLECDVKAGTISVTGKCNAKVPTITRVTDPTPELNAGV